MRTRSIVSAVALATALTLSLAACSQPKDTAADTAASVSPTLAAASDAAPAASAATTPAATPSASAAPVPTPSASATPAAKAKVAAAAQAAAAVPAPAPVATAVAVAAPPPAVFARCAVCHNAAKGAEDKIGPNLYGIYGTKAGVGKYAFSDALKGSGLVWNDDNLDKWIEGPMTLVPGTNMAFPGIKDPAKRAALIAYLKSQR
ncbi:MAG: c-type cytochrome [Proteobacteria bacterium]|nr:c-type cytochrome [Pseudomonadota bacterium]